MKYDLQVSQIQPIIHSAQNILIAVSSEVSEDKLASGLALFLSLKQAGKNVSIVSDAALTVGFTHLFGIGNIKNSLPQSSGGNYTITLGNVVGTDGMIPALQNLDWAPCGTNKTDLKLTFHVNPGQKFEPTFVTPEYESGNFDLIITIGAATWLALGTIYANNSQAFSGSTVLNIDNNPENTNFGQLNLIDGGASLSEIIGLILPALSLPYEGDCASNIIAGLFASTNSLQSASADSFEVMAQALRVGGQKPSSIPNTAPMSDPNAQVAATTGMPAWVSPPQQAAPQETVQPENPTQGLNISPFLNPQNFSVDVSSAQTQPEPAKPEEQSSQEEVPMGEAAQTISPEADWLTPKIFKSNKIG